MMHIKMIADDAEVEKVVDVSDGETKADATDIQIVANDAGGKIMVK